ncbi:DUF6634 family protein [Tritonibacter multivorans]|nr:DUF6634 family protein [Tritonibacter multivorans]MDA7422207.1 hypothetical protein [Tritonibacter multivorans]
MSDEFHGYEKSIFWLLERENFYCHSQPHECAQISKMRIFQSFLFAKLPVCTFCRVTIRAASERAFIVSIQCGSELCMPGRKAATGQDMFKNTDQSHTADFIDRCILAFQAALDGPDPADKENEAPLLCDYVAVITGRKLSLQGFALDHPRLGTGPLQTSLLIHVSNDQKWARTLSRWYRPDARLALDPSVQNMDWDGSNFFESTGLCGVCVPMSVARQVLNQRPAEILSLALAIGDAQAAKELKKIEGQWPIF